MWLKKLTTVSAEVRTNAPSGVRGMNGKGFSGFLGSRPPARPAPRRRRFLASSSDIPQFIEPAGPRAKSIRRI